MKKWFWLFFIFTIIIVIILEKSGVRLANAIAPFEETELFNYTDGTSPVPGWETINFRCPGNCNYIGDIINYDNTKAVWAVNNGHYGIRITPQTETTFTQTFPASWPTNLNNYSMEFDIAAFSSDTYDRNIMVRQEITSDRWRWYEIHMVNNYIYLDKADRYDNEYKGKLLTFTNYHCLASESCHLKIDVYQNHIWIYKDGALLINYIDTDMPFLTGKAGFMSGVLERNGDVWFDNLMIKELPFSPDSTPDPNATPTPYATPTPGGTPTQTPTSTATPIITPITTPTPIVTPVATPIPVSGNTSNTPDIKQTNPSWGNEIYDSAQDWAPTNPYIKNWGCAMTSADMILRFFNHDIWPNELNNWLKNQPDGYLRNGLVNWLAISRFTKNNTKKINISGDLPILEYSRVNNPKTKDIADTLTKSIPPILGVPGHFVVAKAKFGSDFYLNDPGFNYSLLSQLTKAKGSVTSLGRFSPTHTDLSYLLYVIDEPFSLKIYDDHNRVVGAGPYTDYLIDDNNPNLVSTKLKTYYFPKPPDGFYRLEIKGPKNVPYIIQGYLYDTTGHLYTTNYSLKSYQLAYNKKNYLISSFEGGKLTMSISFDYLLMFIQACHDDGTIKGEQLYRFLKETVQTAKNSYDKQKFIASKSLLIIAKEAVRFSPPNTIDKITADWFSMAIDTQINSF